MTIQILIASNHLATVELVKNAVASRDCTVITASSMALALFLAQKNFPDLIVSDPQLPDGSGLRFLTEIKEDPELSVIPFLFIIDKKYKEQQTSFSPEPDGVIYYPIGAEDLFAIIDSHVHKRLRYKSRRVEESTE